MLDAAAAAEVLEAFAAEVDDASDAVLEDEDEEALELELELVANLPTLPVQYLPGGHAPAPPKLHPCH